MRNIVSVSWGDHLDFGVGDGRLDTPEKLARGMSAWQEEFQAGKVFWRDQRVHQQHYVGFTAPGAETRPEREMPVDEFQVLIEQAHAQGLQAYIYIDMFDEGWPLGAPEERAVSYHNRYHGREIAAQSRFTHENPEYLEVDRSGKKRHFGIMCYAYPEVRDYRLALYKEVLADYDFDGLFICTRSQSKPADHGDQFGFNPPIVEEYERRHGKNILKEDFDLDAWRKLRGEYVTAFFRDVSAYLQSRGKRFAVGIPRGDVLGPPVGNLHLDWRTWVTEGIVNELIIDQVARVCPSTWLKLWPMHNGYGYAQNYFSGLNMLSLEEDVRENYGPWCAQHGVGLYLARMWHPYDSQVEEGLYELPGVSGLVFGSFRRDNPDAIEEDRWYFRGD